MGSGRMPTRRLAGPEVLVTGRFDLSSVRKKSRVSLIYRRMQAQLVRTLSERTRLAKRDRSSVMISQWARIVHLRRNLDVRRPRLLCGPKNASLSGQFHLFNHRVVTKASSRCRLYIKRAKNSTLLNLQRTSTSP